MKLKLSTIFIPLGMALLLSACGGLPLVQPESFQTKTTAEAAVGDVAPATPTPAEAVFQSPLPTPVGPTLTPPATPPYQPPLCKFEGDVAGKPAAPSQLDEFLFSNPEVIFSREAPIEIIQWLPDSRRLLLHIRHQTRQSIEVLDTVTGQTEVYADNLQSANQVRWVANENGVVYTDHKTQEFSGVDQYGLWLSRGQEQEPQLLLEDAEQLRTEAGARQLPPEIAQALNVYDFPFDPEQWRYDKYPEDSYYLQSWSDVKFASSVSPDGSKAVFYGVPWLYLVDLKTNQPCEVDLGQYFRAYTVQWSTDGRFIAMFTTTGYREELIRFTKLQVLDTQTGLIYQPELHIKHLWTVKWISNNHFVVMGASDNHNNPYQNQQIILVDALASDFRLVLPEHVFGGGQPNFQLAVSPNEQMLSVQCPVWPEGEALILEDRICLISIRHTQ